MKEKRRDNKGRVLFTGEVQESNGRYRYRYTDINGKRRTIYSWRLTSSDPIPDGKRSCEPLRDLEAKVQNLQFIGVIDTNMTVLQLLEQYLSLKTNVSHNTIVQYKTVYNLISKYPFSRLLIKKIRPSTAKEFFIKLHKDGKKFETILKVRKQLRPAFQMAVDDGLLYNNPFNFKLSSIVKNDSRPREAISKYDEERFLNFCKNDKFYQRYYDVFFILFNTGLRISELCGLTLNDIDFNTNTIYINKQLQRVQNYETEQPEIVVTETKTTNAHREIPMVKEVKEAFQRIVNNRINPKVETIISGYIGFIFIKRNGNPTVASDWRYKMSRAVSKYNKTHREQLPNITPHICRHTFCSNMAKGGMSPKALQYLMGHSNITITLNIYTHIGSEDARRELERIII